MIGWRAPVASSPVTGEVVVPGSKSTTARSYLLAAMADGPSTLTGALAARDTRLMRAGLEVLGVEFTELSPDQVRVTPPAGFRGGGRIEVGLAGTVLRFLPPLAALAPEPTTFVGDAEASARPISPLLGALADLGAAVSQPYTLPFRVGGELRGREVELDASGSSQFVSALLLVGARLPAGLRIRHLGGPLPSLPHIEMTVSMLARRGVSVSQLGPSWWQVEPGAIAGLDERVEPDLTNAATMLAAAVATGGSLTTAWPQNSLQAADGLADALAAFGARLEYRGEREARQLTVTGPARLQGVELDLHEISELTPVVTALACLADTPSVIRGVGHIRRHETDRLAALERGLGALGAQVRQTADGLTVAPAPLHGGVFPSQADHRMAHAAALVGLVIPGVEVDDIGCTSKTLPDFPGLWASLLGAAA